MKIKKKTLRLGQFLWGSLIAFLILPLCGVPPVNAQTPQEIAKKTLAATVLLVMEDANGKPLGLGSGFFVDTNLIATNFHVIEGATQGIAKLVEQETEYIIEYFTAMDEKNDLTILQVAVPDIQPLPLGDSDTVEIGDAVYVAGNPKGYFEGTFSDGIISAIRGETASKRLQMTAPVSSGSSGGPVLNQSGEVIGVSFATFRDGQNLNFAIPSNYLKGLVACIRGITKFNQGQYATAIADFDMAIRLNPNYTDAHMWRGIVKYELEQRAAALSDFDIVLQLKIQKRLQNRKTTRENLGQEIAVITDFNTAIRFSPNNASIYMWRGIVRNELGQHVAAIADLDTAIRLEPDFAFAYNYRGNARSSLGQHDAAIADYDTAIRLAPHFALSYSHRAWIKTELGQYEDAIADCDKAIHLEPNSVPAYYTRGFIKGKLDLYKDATADFDTAIRLAPHFALSYSYRGLAKYMRSQHATAIADLDTAINLAPDNAEVYYNRAWIKTELGQYGDAIADFDAVIRLEPDNADAYLNRGLAKGKLKRHAAAIKDYDTVIRLNPNNTNKADAYNNRGLAKASLGQYIAAIKDYDIAIHLESDFSWPYYNRGLAKYNLGQTRQAKQDFQMALKLAERAGDEDFKIRVESVVRGLY